MEQKQEKAPPYNRKFQGRLAVIKDTFSLAQWKNKVVVDLGCGEGNFVAGLAPICKHVIAVDNDEKEIEKAVWKCKEFSNVTFIHSDAETALSHVGPVDVVLYLSVAHHVLSGVSYYEQSPDKVGFDALIRLLFKIRQNTKMLFFEMGMPYEPRHWARFLPAYMDDVWIRSSLLLYCGFENTSMYRRPECSSMFASDNDIQDYLHDRHYNWLSRSPGWFQKLLKFDNRDNRPLFIAS